MSDVMDGEKPPPNRRQRRAAARRNQILDAAAKLFAEKGFHRTTTRDIAQAADIAEGTLYNYFASKEDLLLGIMARLEESQHLANRLKNSLPEEAWDFFHSILQERRRFSEQNRAMLQSVLSEILVNPELRRRYYQELVLPNLNLLEAHLQERIEQGQIRWLDASLAVRILSALMTGLYVLEVLGDPVVHQRWDELSQLITQIFFRGTDANASQPF